MKTKLMIALLIILAKTTCFAGADAIKRIFTNESTVTLTSDYFKVVVGEHLKVVFVDDPGLDVRIDGDSKFQSALKLEVVNHTLYLSLSGYKKQKGTVYVPIKKNASEILVKSDAKIYSEGFLNCNNLKVLINEGGYAHMKNWGHVEYKGLDSELNFEKFQEITL